MISVSNFIALKAEIKPGVTVATIDQVCREKGNGEKWVTQFLQNQSNYTDPLTESIDCDKACESLRTCYDQYFLKSFGRQMLATSVVSLLQSFKAWQLINSFIISDHKALIERTKEKLKKCAKIYIHMVDLEILNAEHVQKLSRAQELLTDIKDNIELITNDVKNKVAEAERLRDNSYFSALVNLFSTITNGVVFHSIENSIGENSASGIVTELSFIAQAGCTIGDLIHANKAGILVEQLEKQLQISQELGSEYDRLVKRGEELSKKPTSA